MGMLSSSLSAMTGRAFLKAMAWIWSSLSGRMVYRTARYQFESNSSSTAARYGQLSVRYDLERLASDWDRLHFLFALIRPTVASSVDAAPAETCILESMEVQREGVMSKLQSLYVANGPMHNVRCDLERPL